MNIYDIIPEISNNVLFKNADKNTVCRYLMDENLTVVKYASGEVIISPTSDPVPVGIVTRGAVEITSATEKHKVLLKTASRGAMFGISTLFAQNSKFPSKISARSEAEVLFISQKAFKDMLFSDSDLMKSFLDFMSKKVIYLNKKIASYTAGNTECKVAYFLCENDVNGVVSVDMSLSDIAVMLDIGRASLYRAFDKFEAEGLIERKGRNIKILDMKKIKKIYN